MPSVPPSRADTSPVLIRRFPLKAGFLDVVLRLRCGDDGMVPDVWLMLDDAAGVTRGSEHR